MFADKLQNPFLRPSPFAASSANYTSSYTSGSYNPPSRTPPKYNSYKNFDDVRPSLPATNNQYSHYEHHYNPHSSHAFETKDIDSILSKNPFNRQYKPSFGGSRANRDLSPSRAASNAYDYPNSYNYEGYGATPRNYDSNRPSGTQGPRYTENTSRLTPTKKYDNYLSTSSADSATTYINKIYDLDEDRNSVNETGKPLVNPFFRKNLLKTSNEPEVGSDYDSMALKYMGYRMEDKRQRDPINERDNYDSGYYCSKNDSSLNRGLSFGAAAVNNDPYGKYLDDYKNNEDSRPKVNYDINSEIENIYGASGFKQEPRGGINSTANLQYKSQGYPNSSSYNHYGSENYEPRFGSNTHNYESTFNKKPQSSKYIDSKYDKDDYRTNFNNERQAYRYNLDNEYEGAVKPTSQFRKSKDLDNMEDKIIKFEEERVPFDEESEEEITKYQGYAYQGKFQTLGANPYASKPQEHDYKIKEYEEGTSFGAREPHKFASSQVDEYKNPQDMQKKITENKYRKLGLTNNNEGPTKTHKEASGFNDGISARPQLSKVPSRDTAEHPRVLQINGILFHRIEVM